jgi:hypothetical protein
MDAFAVDARDIQKLYKRFAKLDRNKKGYITTADLQLIPELSMVCAFCVLNAYGLLVTRHCSINE